MISNSRALFIAILFGITFVSSFPFIQIYAFHMVSFIGYLTIKEI